MKNIKLAIIALLGFSTACSTVKEGTKSKKEDSDKIEAAPSLIVMYGVRRPVEASGEVKKVETPSTDKAPYATNSELQNSAK